jgi:acyl-CoA hydrolase
MRRAAGKARLISAEEAAGLVRSGMWLDYGGILCQPDVFDKALAARKAELHHVKIRSCLSMRPRAVLEVDPAGEHFHWFSTHFSAYERRMNVAGRCNYLPVHLGEVPDYYRRFIDPVDIVILKTCRIDENGLFNFGPTNLWHRAIIERARMVIVEVTDGLPYLFGVDNGVHISEVDYIIEGDNQPAPELPNPPPTEVDRIVGRLIAAEIDDGSCLQIGIGGMPNAVCAQLLDSGAQDLGIHTEMLTDGLIDLYRAGQVNGRRKTLDPGKIGFTFALGSRSLYDALHRNPDIECHPVDYTNLPHNIMRNERVVSINNTTQIDLQGQAASESAGHRHISGTGGQSQFVRGAYASTGGKSFICLSSTYEKHGQRQSRIVLSLTPGNIVTTPRTDAMYVVTEYGIANLKGRSVAERAMALISLAHPDFREELERQAHEHHLITPAMRAALSSPCEPPKPEMTIPLTAPPTT